MDQWEKSGWLGVDLAMLGWAVGWLVSHPKSWERLRFWSEE
jgi:hypothetical protein